MPKWKNYLKGLYDTKPAHQQIIVTGSARLDIVRRVGDSLAGRFFLHHLMPFSPAELRATSLADDIGRFIERGGFPEPFLTNEPIEAERWRSQYVDSLLRFDIFELNQIENIKNMQLIVELLRSRIGSPVSYQSIAEDLGVSPHTVKKYIQILESLYIVFRVTPFARDIARSLRKEPKLYFYDTGLVRGDDGAKLENFVAICLLKHVHAKNDYEGKKYALHYLRTKDGLEVDFALANDFVIEQMIEVKQSNHNLNPALLRFQQKYNFQAIQLVKELRHERQAQNIAILRVLDFLKTLQL
jgi:predicted AAA+ superfamily ATPase